MIKAFIDSKNIYFYNQITQLLYGQPIQLISSLQGSLSETEIIITDGSNPEVYIQPTTESPIHIPVFTIAKEIPEYISEMDKRFFYPLGNLNPEQFVKEVENWINVWDFISAVLEDNEKYETTQEQLITKLEGYQHALKEATIYQKNAMICPQTQRFVYSLLYEPAYGVSGDFYNTFVTEENAIFVMGDVSNHGIGSAIIGAAFQTLIDTYMDLHPDADIIELANYVRTHNCYHRKLQDPEYSIQALFVQIRDNRLSLLSFGSGGEPAILIKKQGNGTYRVLCTDLIERTVQRLAENQKEITGNDLVQMPFNPGDGLILYSDGITEAFSHNQQDKTHCEKYQYSKEGIVACVSRELTLHPERKWTPDHIIQAIQEDLDNYIQSDLEEEQAHSHDDVTMLVIQSIEGEK